MTGNKEQSNSISQEEQATAPNSSAAEAVLNWVKKEGYPTEYKTAHIFRKMGCRVFQGRYFEDQDEGKLREVDVLALQTTSHQEWGFLRTSHVVECKWSGEKPWVVFTSPSGIAPAACITQTYGSDLGEALLWAVAGDKRLHDLRLFSTPEEAGFNGRQAFSSATGADHFYNALRGVTGNALSYLRQYDMGLPEVTFRPSGVIAFPMVVVEGQLFKAYFDDVLQDIRIEEVDDLRCHWHGAKNWRLNSTVDIVTMRSLEAFVANRSEECRQLLELLLPVADKIKRSWDEGSLEPMEIAPVSRGVLGLPSLLRAAVRRGENKGRA